MVDQTSKKVILIASDSVAAAGLFSVLLFDLATFAFAMVSVCLVKIPEEVQKKKHEKHVQQLKQQQ